MGSAPTRADSTEPASHPRERIPLVVCLDAEDIIAPASDDATLWMAEELSAHGIRATYFVMGELARRWVTRGRVDVIQALQQHDIGFHSTWHSVHPTTTEVCLDLDTQAGVAALWEREREGWMDAERIFERPLIGWGRTGGSWAPSTMALMAREGRCYAYSPVRVPGHNVCWYAGCLGFHGEGIGMFDSTFADPRAFEQRLEAVNRAIDTYAASDRRGAEWICWFACHPTRAIHTDFWDGVNFARGANPPEAQWRAAPALPACRIPTVKSSFRRMCEALRDDTRVEVVGLSELAARYGGQPSWASHAEVLRAARTIAEAGRVVIADRFSAAELLIMMCEAATQPAERYARPSALGPLSDSGVSVDWRFPAPDVAAGATCVLARSAGGYLPADVEIAGRAVGIGAYCVLLARALAGEPEPQAGRVPNWPQEADAIAAEVAGTIRGWTIHPPDMNLDKVLEQTRLQCWTLKPAWPRADLTD